MRAVAPAVVVAQDEVIVNALAPVLAAEDERRFDAGDQVPLLVFVLGLRGL